MQGIGKKHYLSIATDATSAFYRPQQIVPTVLLFLLSGNEFNS
jgi:hypothetical protein